MKFKKIFRKLLCKHEFKLEKKFYGDMKNYGYGVVRCSKCGKGRVIK